RHSRARDPELPHGPQDDLELDLLPVQALRIEVVEPELLRRNRVELRSDLLDPVDLEGADDDVAVTVPLHVEERVRHRQRDLVPHLGRADRVGVDENVCHGGLDRTSTLANRGRSPPAGAGIDRRLRPRARPRAAQGHPSLRRPRPPRQRHRRLQRHLRRPRAVPEAQLIIAHAGIADLGELAGAFGGKAGVFFDTSVWSPIDLLSLYHLVSPEQVVYASDYPYGQQPSSLLIAVRTAKVTGFDDEQLRGMLWGNACRIADSEPP